MDFGKLSIEDSRERTLRSLKLDLEVYEQELKNPMNLHKFDEIRKKIEDIKSEIEVLENPQPLPLNTMLLNGLQNNIDELDRQLQNEDDMNKGMLIKARQTKCIEALATRQAPVTSPEELNEAVDQIQSDQRLLNVLSVGKVDEVDLHLFMNSDMAAFVSGEFEHEIKVATEKMFTNDLVKSAKGVPREQLFEEADQAWLKFKNEQQQDIQIIQHEIQKMLKTIPNANTAERQRLRDQIRNYSDTISHLQAQIDECRAAWTHRFRTQIEIKRSPADLAGSVDPETLNRLKTLLTEAQGIRAERIQTYLSEQFTELKKQFKEIKRQNIFSEVMEKKIEDVLNGARKEIVDQKISDPKTLRELAGNFQTAKRRLATSATEIKQAQEQRPKLEAEAQKDYSEIKDVMANVSSEKIEEVKIKYLGELKAKGISEDSKIAEKALKGLEALAGENVVMDVRDEKTGEVTSAVKSNTAISEFEEQLENISEMSTEELVALHQDLDVFKRNIENLRNLDSLVEEALSPGNQDAKLAHQTIQDLERAKNPDDIRHIIETNLGSEHISFKTHDQFKSDHKDTTKGHMVFQEQGEKWRIIIDESVFQEEKALEKLKQELTHELLHLEFEKSDHVKNGVRQKLIEDHPKEWQQIRSTFLQMVKEQNKKPPHGDTWEDDDILSELYAMQNEMGRTWSTGNSTKQKLNNLLAGIGAAENMGEVAEKIRGYEAGADDTAAKIKERGYEGGADEKEFGEDVGRLAISSSENLSNSEAVYIANQEKIKNIHERIKELKSSDHLGKVPQAEELLSAISNYNNATDRLNDELRDDPGSEILDEHIKHRLGKMTGDLSAVEDGVGKAARNAPNTEIGFFRKLWINTNFLSLESIAQVGIDTYEFYQRRYKRKMTDQAARLGMALASGTALGSEFYARQQKAEAEEVSEWKSRYENLDAWQLMDEMRKIAASTAPSQDQLKAILRILAEKGRIDWRDPNLWICLNKLQSTTELKPGDKLLLHNPVLLRQRLQTALGEIYDYDEFSSLERSNEGSYQSEKGKYDTLHSRMQDTLDDRLDELLAQHRAGEQVDPILYESIMEYSIKNGKCFAENIMFHLIAGMASGLLAPDRGLALGDHLNQWPAVDWFTSLSPPYDKNDFYKLCMDYFPDDFRRGSITASGFGDQFKNFYWTEIQNDDKVIQRVKKSVGERAWDHDWGRSIACLGDAQTARKFLAGRSGQIETKSTAVQNAYVGMVMFLEENARNPRFADRKNFARIAGCIAMSEGMLEGAAFKEKSKDINTRADAAMNNDIPREAGIGRHPESNLKAHRGMARDFLYQIDQPFFEIILGREARTDEVKEQMGTQARNYLSQRYPTLAAELADVESIDQIYERIDLIISTMFENQYMSEAEFQRILANTAP